MSPIPIISSLITLARFYYDLVISCIVLFVGRLLPVITLDHTDLSGKRVIITGANSGIGFSIASSLARQNATVYLACRNVKKAEDAAAKIADALVDGEGSSKRVHVLQLDTSDLSSVRSFADTWQKQHENVDINILIHNAGISGSNEDATKEGLGAIYVTNFLGSFLLTSLLEKNLSDDARVIFTSSTGQYGGNIFRLFFNRGFLPSQGFWTKRADSGFYADTKCMQVTFAKLLQRHWNAGQASTRRVVHAFTPGYTFTEIFAKNRLLNTGFDPLFWFLNNATRISTSVGVGAKTGVWLATTSDRSVTDPSSGGRYWDRCVSRTTVADAIEATLGIGVLERIWDLWTIDSKAEWSG